MKKYILIRLAVLFTFLLTDKIFGQSNHVLWYNKPAIFFEESLVLGNGKVGASVFGGVNSDKIILNDATLWSGEPIKADINPEAYKNLPFIRAALKNGNNKLADSLNRKLQGKFSESFAPLGNLIIDFKHTGTVQNYYRELNINEAISKVTYGVNGIKYTREYFISYPDQLMLIKLTSSKSGALNFDLRLNSLLHSKTSCTEKVFKMKGYAPYHAEPSYVGNISDPIKFEKNRGTRFTTLAKIKNIDGDISSNDSILALRNATEAIIYISIATSFNGFDKDPASEGLNDEALAEKGLENAFLKSYTEIRKSHLEDYQKFFNRMSLNLGSTQASDLPTDERLKRYAQGKEDKNLEVLYFQFGRYLLISSSRTKGVPANLQGIWNYHMRPPWSSNYTLNINLEENYWLAENANLSEMHMPLLSFIKNLSETGKATAKNFYGSRGWAAGHNSDIWAMSNPAGNFGEGNPNWANWNMGGVWLSTHLWEHYVYTKDIDFLRNEGYPLMKGAATFCMDWLIAGEKGYLFTSPSTSPENFYLTPQGYSGATLFGGTADLAMIRELLEDTYKAAEILQNDNEFKLQLQQTTSRLQPYQIGQKGNLQEWYYDWEDGELNHRHVSHLFGLYPGNHLSLKATPGLAQACRRTLEMRGDETTGWSKGWRINLWARLGDGDHAYKMFRSLLNYAQPDAETNYEKGGGTYPNLLDAHPPFQIDGNFGGTAGVIEMLVQSDEHEIRLLPALPSAWNSGNLKGCRAKGGFEVSMEWENRGLKKVILYSVQGGTTKILSGNKEKDISLKPKQRVEIIW